MEFFDPNPNPKEEPLSQPTANPDEPSQKLDENPHINPEPAIEEPQQLTEPLPIEPEQQIQIDAQTEHIELQLTDAASSTIQLTDHQSTPMHIDEIKTEAPLPSEPTESSSNLVELTTIHNPTEQIIIDPMNAVLEVVEQPVVVNTSSILDPNTAILVLNSTNSAANLTLETSELGVNSALGLDADGDESNLPEDDQNDTSLKDIEDGLDMSPGFSGIGGSSFVMNGNNVSTHTFRKTEWDVKKLENYVRLSFGDPTPMENMQPVVMNKFLKSFFELDKKSDGMDYEPESLIGFMNSFERYLKTKNYSESLLRSETFKESRTVLKKKRDLVRSIGKLIRTKTKDTCYLLQFHRNLLKEKGLLNRDNPDCLLAEIYLNNMIHFGEFLKEDKAWRGNLNLVWGDMLLERDPHNGLEYLTLATYAKKTARNNPNQSSPSQPNQPRTNSRTKTGTQTSKLRAAAAAAAAANAVNGVMQNPSNLNQSTLDLNSPRVYARQPPNYCPIEAYKIYRSRRPNNCLDRDSPFYLAPLFKSKNQSKVWYKALAMSCQRLDALFYCLFKKAGVDLTSLASMSQQQQQQAVAAAASIIDQNNPNQIVNINALNLGPAAIAAQQTPAMPAQQWKGAKDHHHHDELMGSQAAQTTAYYHSSNGAQSGAGHHIVTTVPAQVQVQVQVQVQLPQHQQQQAANSNSHGLNAGSAVTLLA